MADSIASTSHQARILIVDDHPNTASMLARALGQFKTPVEVLTARSGQEALDTIGNNAIDVLITDFMMPGMNGLELIEKLQGGHEPAHTILITAYDTPGLAATARRLRIKDYLVKPVQPEKIQTIVSQALEGLHPAQVAAAAQTFNRTQFKILIADDRSDNVQLLSTRLSSEGYNFITAADGEETLAQIYAELPDLVLLDINMPKKDGFEVLAEMRADPRIAHIPVIIITAARIEPRDVRQGLSLGADDYVTKPFDWRELTARVRSKLRVKLAEDALRRRNRELGLLPEIGQDLSARMDIEELATVTLRRSVPALEAINGYIVIFQPDGSVLHQIHTTADFSPWSWQVAKEKLVSEGVAPYVVSARKGMIIENTLTDPRWLKLTNDPTRSAIAVPLLSRRGVIGVLTLHHSQRAYFTQDHLTLLQAIAGQAAIAIENAQFYAIERKRVTELVALNRLTREISLFTRSTELFERTADLIHQTLDYPVVSLWLTDGESPQLCNVAGAETGLRPSLLALAPQQVAATGQPAHFSGAVEERARPRERPGAPPTLSAVAVPLIWDSKVSGVLAIHSMRPHAFQESDRVVLENLASQIATAFDRIRLFESVEQEERRLSAILRSAADAILVIDAEGCLQLMNPAGEKLFADVETRLGASLPLGKGYDALVNMLERARLSGQPEQGEIVWPDKRTFATVITPIEEGGQVAVLHDVSHFKDLDRVKNEFIATASHDLKNPITAVMGYSYLVTKLGPLTLQQHEYLDRIDKATKQMNELVQNLLEMARIDMGVGLKLEPCNVLDLFTGVADEFTTQAANKQQTLTLMPFASQAQVLGDAPRLRQVARNLVGNALKYTPDGGQITISAEIGEGAVQIKIQDSGPGISEHDLPYIFEKFYRAQHGDLKEIEGNGLGLAIVKSIVEQHGGAISVKSEERQGSCFSFSLPLVSAEAIKR
ncbi:MAG: response regulator [Chloroflexi bacterium]|nr:response regulator [Chloroflexota bacterium]